MAKKDDGLTARERKAARIWGRGYEKTQADYMAQLKREAEQKK